MATSRTSQFGSNFVSDSSFSVSSNKLSKTVFVDLDEQPVKAKVVREGLQVPNVTPDSVRVDAFLSGLTLTQRPRSPRVVAQSIAHGIKVGRGTEVNLVLTERSNVPLGLFDAVHVDVRDISVEDMLTRVSGSTTLQNLVLKYDSADAVSSADRVVLTQLLASEADLGIDETAAGANFNAGFNAVRAALAFK